MDSSGNVATAVRTVIVRNNADAGIITLLGDADMTVSHNSTFTDPGAEVKDIDGQALDLAPLSISGDVDTSRIGEYTLEYNYTTTEGHESRVVRRTVTVVDDEAPVITLAGDAEVTVIQGASYTDAGATATDNYDGNFLAIGSSQNIPTDGLILHLDASSIQGKSEGDPVPIWFDTSPNQNHADQSAGTPTYTASALNGLPAVHFDGESRLAVSNSVGATYSILTVSQLSGNSNQRLLSSSSQNWLLGYHAGYQHRMWVPNGFVTSTQIPADTQPHLYSATSGNQKVHFYADGADLSALPGRPDNTITMGFFQLGAYSDGQQAGAGDVAEVIIYNRVLTGTERRSIEAGLNAKYGLNGVTVAQTPVDTSTLGEYSVIYQTTDTAGNLATAVRKVTVIADPTAPTITLNGPDYLVFEANPTYTDAGAVLKDSGGTDLDAGLMDVENTVLPSVPGLYTVTYSYTPDAGNPALPITRQVEVRDTLPPVITLNGPEVVKLEVGATYMEERATATDQALGDVPVLDSVNYTFGRLAHLGYKGSKNDSALDLSDGGGLLGITPAGSGFFTNGPGGRGLDFNGDGDFTGAGVGINQNDNYQNLIHGVFVVQVAGKYGFDLVQRDDRASTWLDLDQDGVFELPGDKGNERLRGPSSTGTVEVDLEPGIYYFATAHREGGGGSGVHVRYNKDGSAKSNIQPGNPAQAGSWASIETTPFDTIAAGTFTIEYTAYDAVGNKATALRTVVVVDDATLPFIALNGGLEVEHELGTPFTDPQATVTSGQTVVKSDLAGQGTVDVDNLGSYTLTYDYTHTDSKVAETVTRTVHVIDTTAPTATLTAHASGGTDTVTLIVGQTWEDPGVAITDADTDAWFVSSRKYIPNRLNYAGFMLDHTDNHIRFDRNDDLFDRTPSGQGYFTTGPRDRGFDFIHDDDFRRGPTGITRGDDYQILVHGYFLAQVDGEYEFRGENAQNRLCINLDFHDDGIFHDLPDRLTWGEETAIATLEAGKYYPFAIGLTHDNSTGKGRVLFKTPAGTTNSQALTILKPSLKTQAGLWYAEGDGPIDTGFPGTHNITYYILDRSGNMTTLQRAVIVEPDPNAPILTLLGDEETAHQQGETYDDDGVSVVDASGDDITDPLPVLTITLNGQDVGAVDGAVAGTHEIQYDFTDNSARKAIPVFRTVIVADTAPPVITINGDNPVTLPPGVEYLDPGATATDSLDGDITVTVTNSSPATGRFLPGLIIGEFSGLNLTSENNESLGVDPLGPSIAQTSSSPPWKNNVTYVYTGEIYDADGVMSFSESIDDLTHLSINGEVVLNDGTWSTDASVALDLGFGGWFPFELRVNNGTGGAGQVNAPGFGWDPEGGNNYTAPQNSDADTMDLFRARAADPSILISNSIGIQTLTYTATDAAGNTTTVVREIIIEDDLTLPVIILQGEGEMTQEAGQPFTDPGYEPQDRKGNVLPGTVQTSGTVDHTQLGEYVLTYDYTDPDGRAAGTLRRYVQVVDTTPPDLQLTDGIKLRWDIGAEWIDPGYSVTDNLDNAPEVSIKFIASGFQPHLHWEFDSEDGSVAHEIMQGLEGTLKNFPDPVADSWSDDAKYGKALKFEAANASYVELPGSALLDLQTYTISVWVKTDNFNRSMFIFEKTTNDTVNSQYNLFFENDNTINHRIIDEGSNMNPVAANSSALLLPDVWQHIAVTYDGTDLSMYIEGELAATDSPTVPITSNPTGKAYIGAMAPGGSYYFTGLLDDLKVYSFAATEHQISQIQKRSGVDTAAEQKTPPYTLEYTATDSLGNVTVVERKVVVSNDVTPPVLLLNGAAEMDVELNSSFTDPGVSASDAVDTTLNAALVVTTGSVDTSKAGTYTLTYTVSDFSFNTSTLTRTVTVTDPDPPTDPLEIWTNDKLGSLAPAKQDPEADPDHDRVPNLLEYAIGGNPTNPDRKDTLPEVDANSGSLKVTFFRVKASVDPSLTYKVELTRKLKNATWSEADVTVTVDADQTGVPTDYERVTATANTPIASETQKRQFIRVTVER